MTSGKKISLTGDSLMTALEAACRGLVYVSETDSPVEAFFITRCERSAPCEYTFLAEKEPAEDDADCTARQFFERLTSDKEWHTQSDKRSVRRYRRLQKLIFDNLANVRLVRLGRVRIDVFLFGEDVEGNIAGIRTKAVET